MCVRVHALGSFGPGKSLRKEAMNFNLILRTIQPPQRRDFSDRCCVLWKECSVEHTAFVAKMLVKNHPLSSVTPMALKKPRHIQTEFFKKTKPKKLAV